ncbi:aldose 1-epimerase [Mesorhizobium carmichaelinearum]|uniref:aldose 1-epimerase n=1 Tax=Mesorhizobium carmichaelinearum TaxID=1208188 RepID=UPI001FCE4083|nr:aldose 1-epimerase [Mesorhizobium carmichaelinearum]
MIRTIEIRNGDLSAEIVPSLGAGLARFDRGRAPLFRPWPDGGSTNPFDLACNLLVPWSNRISGGGFTFDNTFHELLPNVAGEPFPIHGNGFSSAWDVDSLMPDKARLSLVSEGPGPYRYRAEVAYALTERALDLRLQVLNRAPVRLPFGLGIHPWLPRTAQTTLHAPASQVCLELPSHLPDRFEDVATCPDWDFAAPAALPSGWINNAFAGWAGVASLYWPEQNRGLRIEASPALSFYLIYSPSQASDFVCFEPVSHAVDAHNRGSVDKWNGLSVLGPGESLVAGCSFAVI